MPSTINATPTSSGLVQSADASGVLALQTGGTTAVTIDGSQNVGINTTSPSYKLDVQRTASNGTGVVDVLRLRSTGDNADDGPRLLLTCGNSTTGGAGIGAGGVALNSANLLFYAGGNTERMRIDSSGNVLVGTTTVRAKISNDFNGGTNNGIALNDTASAASTAYAAFYVSGSAIGSIVRVGSTSAVVYNTTSDERLKSNIEDANPVLDKLMTVKVRQFDWTGGDSHQEAGFIAQELAPVLSGIVTEGKTEEDMWQLDYARLTPYLVKAIQEQQALIIQLQADVAALKVQP